MRDLMRISARMRGEQPVFIVGEARSGTSILYRTLQKHPAFRPSTVELAETDIFRLWRRTFLFRDGYPDTLVRYMLGDGAAYRRFLRSIRVPRLVNGGCVAANALLGDRTWLWRANLGPLVVRSYFHHAQQARGCPRLVEKTPTNTGVLDRITLAFPQARMLYIHRHPIDVFTSYRRRALVDAGGGWADIPVEEFVRRYAVSVGRVSEWLRAGHDNLLLVPYAGFTGQPAVEWRRVCRFLDVPYDEAALDERRPDTSRWPVDRHLWGQIVPRTKQWQDYVTAAETALIQDRLAPSMAALGYTRYDADAAVAT